MTTPRCIAIYRDTDRRCSRPACKRGFHVLCGKCATPYLRMLLEDRVSALWMFRRMALAQWETPAQYNVIRWGRRRVA